MSECVSRRPVVLVTGASRGIGAHLARGFAEAGYDVAVTARSEAGLTETCESVRERSAQVLPLELDVTDPGSVEASVTAVLARFGRLDVLVNNAGVIEPEAVIWEGDPDTWWHVLEVNVRGAYLMTRAVCRSMVERRGGRIIMLNSGSGGKDSADLSAYNASKSVLARITNAVTMAGESLGERAVRAFDLAPGVVATDMTASMEMHQGRTEWTDPADVVTLAVAMAAGELDAWAGRMVRAGVDTVASLKARASTGLDDDARRLRWVSYGEGDPVLG